MTRPRIGLTCGYDKFDNHFRASVITNYFDAVTRAGGLPVIFPPLDPDILGDGYAAACDEFLASCQGLLVTGGGDLDPTLWAESAHPQTHTIHPRRQTADLALIRAAEQHRLPILGICLGCQEIAISRGGSLFQHVPEAFGDAVSHSYMAENLRSLHTVLIESDSLLACVVGPEPLEVNSSHHQAVRESGKGMRIVARSPDGIIEAIEDPTPGRFFLAVQWHPENLTDEPRHLALFEALCQAARRRQP